jgi:hypothetical protein
LRVKRWRTLKALTIYDLVKEVKADFDKKEAAGA